MECEVNIVKSSFSAEKEVYVKRQGLEPILTVPFITVKCGDIYFVGGDEYVATEDAHYICSSEHYDMYEDVAFLNGWGPEELDGPWYDDYL